MAIDLECPYYKTEKHGKYLYCECARIQFPDSIARRQIVYKFCASPEGYKACVFKKVLDDYYERLYNNEERKTQNECRSVT